MRLIIFVKIPERVEPIPLDIVDDRPSQIVLAEILLLTELSAQKQSEMEFYIERNGSKLDPKKNLTENGVENGDTLDVIKSTDQPIPMPEDNVKSEGNPMPTLTQALSDSNKNGRVSKKKLNSPPIPGKKIEFD